MGRSCGGSAAASSLVDSPVSGIAEAMPAVVANRMSVMRRSPTMTARSRSMSRPRSAVRAICGLGLPRTVSARVPVHASMAATMAAQSGCPMPPGNGQNRSGLVPMSAARRWNQIASKAIWSLA